MPKGGLIPVPLICILSFGTPVALAEGEAKPDFLARARQSVLDMQPKP
jgi:hypothetical protein